MIGSIYIYKIYRPKYLTLIFNIWFLSRFMLTDRLSFHGMVEQNFEILPNLLLWTFEKRKLFFFRHILTQPIYCLRLILCSTLFVDVCFYVFDLLFMWSLFTESGSSGKYIFQKYTSTLGGPS